MLLILSQKSRRSVDLQAKTGGSRSRRSVERKQTRLLSLCSVNIHRFNNRLCLVFLSLSLSLSHNARLCFRHTTTTPLLLPESVGQKWEAWRDRWLGKQVRSLNAIICIFIPWTGTWQRWKRRYWRAFRPRRENPQRKSFDRFQGIYLARFSRERWAIGARLFRILSAFPVFCFDWFLFRTLFFFNFYWVSISGMNDVRYCCERNLFFFFFSFF